MLCDGARSRPYLASASLPTISSSSPARHCAANRTRRSIRRRATNAAVAVSPGAKKRNRFLLSFIGIKLSKKRFLFFAPGETATAAFVARLRIERRVLFAAQCLAGELDEMVGNEADAKYGLDLAPSQSIVDGAPERPAIIRQNAEIEHDPESHHRSARQI